MSEIIKPVEPKPQSNELRNKIMAVIKMFALLTTSAESISIVNNDNIRFSSKPPETEVQQK